MIATEPARVVYTARAEPARMRRKRLSGVAASAFRGDDGKWHTYLNAAIPNVGRINDAICFRCGLAYSHLMRCEDQPCNECITEAIADHALIVQALYGVDLGWRMPDAYTPDVLRQRTHVSRRRYKRRSSIDGAAIHD